MTGVEVVHAVSGAVDYLRLSVGPAEGDWWSCRRLLDEPDALAELVAGTRRGRGTDRDDVAMSLFVQAYAFRVASAAIGGWLLADAVLDVTPDNTALALGRDRPNALLLHDARVVPAGDPLAVLHEVLVDRHLCELVCAAHAACRVGEALLWGNVAASVASSFGAFMDSFGDRRGELRARLDEFLDGARPELADAGRVVTVGSRWAWERKSCCLWYRTDSGSMCQDCSLWSDDERRARYAAALDADSASS